MIRKMGGWMSVIVAVGLVFVMTEAGAQQKAPEFVMKLGHGSQLKSPLETTGEEFAKRIAEKTNGRLKIEVYGNMQLGQECDMVEGGQLGTVDLTMVLTGPLSGFAPGITVVDLPFFQLRTARLQGAGRGDRSRPVETARTQGDRRAGFFREWFRHITSNKKIMTPADLKGVKLRTMENKVHMATFKEMGAAPVPMVWAKFTRVGARKSLTGEETRSISFTPTPCGKLRSRSS